jgi:hypothetical protein
MQLAAFPPVACKSSRQAASPMITLPQLDPARSPINRWELHARETDVLNE